MRNILCAFLIFLLLGCNSIYPTEIEGFVAPLSARVPMCLDIHVTSPYKVAVVPHGTHTIVYVYNEVGESYDDTMPSLWQFVPSPPTFLEPPSNKLVFIQYVGFSKPFPKVIVSHTWEEIVVNVDE